MIPVNDARAVGSLRARLASGAFAVTAEGLRICAEIIEQIRQIPGVSGVHVMAPGYEQGIPAILDRAGLASAGSQGAGRAPC